MHRPPSQNLHHPQESWKWSGEVTLPHPGFHGSDCLPAKGPIAREGLQSAPGPIEDGSSIVTHSGNHECYLHSRRGGDGDDLTWTP